MNGINDLRLQIAAMAPGTSVHLKVLRNGETREFTAKLGELPEKAGASAPMELSGGGPLHGVQVEKLTPHLARQSGLSVNTKGEVVDDLPPGSSADEAGLRRGDVIEEVNHQSVNNMSDYEHAVQQLGKQAVLLLVNRGGTTTYLVVEPQ